jgi:hypothetical protein
LLGDLGADLEPFQGAPEGFQDLPAHTVPVPGETIPPERIRFGGVSAVFAEPPLRSEALVGFHGFPERLTDRARDGRLQSFQKRSHVGFDASSQTPKGFLQYLISLEKGAQIPG